MEYKLNCLILTKINEKNIGKSNLVDKLRARRVHLYRTCQRRSELSSLFSTAYYASDVTEYMYKISELNKYLCFC